MITKELLEQYAEKLMFKMNDEEYKTLEEEFKTILKQMDLIGEINEIKDVKPMTFPFRNEDVSLREDEIDNTIDTKELLINAKEYERNQIKIPKVVE